MVGIKWDKPVLEIFEKVKMLQVGKCRHVYISTFHLEPGELLHCLENLFRIAEHFRPVRIFFFIYILRKDIIEIEFLLDPGLEFCHLRKNLIMQLPAQILGFSRPDRL